MAELKCGVENCCYNEECCCCKGDIMVGGQHADTSRDTCCESFSQRKGDSYTSGFFFYLACHSCHSKLVMIYCQSLLLLLCLSHSCHSKLVMIYLRSLSGV